MDIQRRYLEAKEKFKKLGIDTDLALDKMDEIKISINCWQLDDVSGNENLEGLGGGISATGNYIGKPNNMDELREDLAFCLDYIPGNHKLNLHAIYGEFDDDYDRQYLKPEYFKNWVEFAKEKNIGLDFNPTLFSHELSKDNLTLSHPDEKIREYWINHCISSYEIASYFAKELNQPVLNNIWIPDGLKDTPGNRMYFRKNLENSLDQIQKNINLNENVYQSVESKVFGIGLESYTVGSHEFYMQYAMKNNLICLLDSGHFNINENIADKISSMLQFNDKLALHLTRSVRWDSDHVIAYNDEIKDILCEIAKYDAYDRVFIGLDFFDASINRMVATILGSRNVLKAILYSLLINHEQLLECDKNLDYTKRFMLQEELKTYPFIDVWNYYCVQNNVSYDETWYEDIIEYENTILRRR